MKFKFSDYAARFWASHAVETETKRNVELETAILETFSRDGRREAMEQLRDRYYTKQKSLLHVLIENQLAFIFINPISKAEHRMYFLILFKLIVRVVELVLPNGAINALDGSGATPLHYAARYGYLEAVMWLVKEAGADVESKDIASVYLPGGRTPLSHAATNGRLEVVKFLVKETGADVESKDIGGKTPLSRAAIYGHLKVVEFLVEEAGADVESKDSYQKTPLGRAADNGHLEIVEFLVREAGADVESKDNIGRTPLSHAAANGHVAIVEFLVEEAGADVESKDKQGQMALDLAKEKGAKEFWWRTEECRVVAALLERGRSEEAALGGGRRDRRSRIRG